MKLVLVLLLVTFCAAKFDYRSLSGYEFHSKFVPKAETYNQNLAIAYCVLFAIVFIYFLLRIFYIEPQNNVQKNKDLSLANTTYITKIYPKIDLSQIYNAEEEILEENDVISIQRNSVGFDSGTDSIKMTIYDGEISIIHKIIKNGTIITNRCRNSNDYEWAINNLLSVLNSQQCFGTTGSEPILGKISNVKIHYLYKFNLGYNLNRSSVLSQLSKNESWLVNNNISNYRCNDKKCVIYFKFDSVSKSKVKINYNGDVYISLTSHNSQPEQSVADTMYWFVKKNF